MIGPKLRKKMIDQYRQQQQQVDEAAIESGVKQQYETLIAEFFSSAYYSTLRCHMLSNLFIFHAQTTRQVFVALLELEGLLRDFGVKTNKLTWREKERKQEDKERQGRTDSEAHPMEIEIGDVNGQSSKLQQAFKDYAVSVLLSHLTPNRAFLSFV